MGNKENAKVITFEDAMNKVKDDSSINQDIHRGDDSGFTGIVSMRDMTDDSGRVVFAKRHNLIVLRGRTFALEKLFNDTIDNFGVNNGNVPYISDLDRRIIAFGVGKGGAPAADPFSPYAPPPTGAAGVGLSQPIPFRLHDRSMAASGDPLLYIPPAEIVNYGASKQVGSSTTQTHYMLKHFDSRDPVWFFNEEANTVYKQIKMSITKDDCRTNSSNYINELSLFFSRAAGNDAQGGVSFANPEMFSRITFPTEYLSANKSLEIVYNVYA